MNWTQTHPHSPLTASHKEIAFSLCDVPSPPSPYSKKGVCLACAITCLTQHRTSRLPLRQVLQSDVPTRFQAVVASINEPQGPVIILHGIILTG